MTGPMKDRIRCGERGAGAEHGIAPPMRESELVVALLEAPVPRPEPLVPEAAKRLCPVWQAVLVGVPFAVMAAAMLAVVTSLAIALPLGAVVGNAKPTWFGHVSEAAALLGAALGIWLVVRWMRGRRAQFTALAREGTIVPSFDLAATGLAGALGTPTGAMVAGAALGSAVAGTMTQIYGGPIAAAELDGTLIEARTVADARGRFRVPDLMLVHASGRYVALMHRTGWIAAQRVLRRKPA